MLHCGCETSVVIAGRGVTSISRLLSLVLPFTAGALLHALEGLCRQAHLPALALVGFALLQPSAVSFGRNINAHLSDCAADQAANVIVAFCSCMSKSISFSETVGVMIVAITCNAERLQKASR